MSLVSVICFPSHEEQTFALLDIQVFFSVSHTSSRSGTAIAGNLQHEGRTK